MKMGVLDYKSFKLKLRLVLAGHIVAMVTYCGTKMTYSTMIGQIFDTMSMASYTGGGYNHPLKSTSWEVLGTVFQS